ncbi:MAG TPA: hypothetical protein VHF69_04240, partial [Candidatus Synoicihabitans sp.]|nr:hypothetical protein [Candidatus Synoicihabitans sp.]
KPAQLQFVITDFEGRETRRRLLPRVAEEGFLIQPIIETQGDFDAFMRGHGHRWAKSVRVEAAPGEEEFWLQVRIEVYRLPDLPIVPVHRNEAVVETGATNRPPLEYGAELPTELMSIEGRPSLFIHAPGKMIVQPAPEDRRLTGWFGLRSPAYDIGHSDGVEFIIDAVWPDGGRQNLLRRLVEPLARTTDRGSQPFTITLPEKAGFKLELLTHAGPTGDSGWDWSYWSELRFAP